MSFVTASKDSTIIEKVADLVVNLVNMNGEGGSEVNLITDLNNFEEREAQENQSHTILS